MVPAGETRLLATTMIGYRRRPRGTWVPVPLLASRPTRRPGVRAFLVSGRRGFLIRVRCGDDELMTPSRRSGTTIGTQQRERWGRYWDKEAASYDRQMKFADRFLLGDSRSWVCAQATGRTLEVAIGTGLNLPFYSREAELTGIDMSEAMLALARARAGQLGLPADLRQADAMDLPFPDGAFDTVVCTYGLCAIPDDSRAVSEMIRVLRPGGLLLLADHIAAGNWPLRGVQRMAEVVTVPLQGEHFLRRPLRHVEAAGLQIERRERFKLGTVERLAARKPPVA